MSSSNKIFFLNTSICLLKRDLLLYRTDFRNIYSAIEFRIRTNLLPNVTRKSKCHARLENQPLETGNYWPLFLRSSI